MGRNSIILILLFAVFVLVGCRSSKTASVVAKADVEHIKSLLAVDGSPVGVSAKMKLAADVDGKTVSSSGNFKAKKGAGVQFSIVPLGLFEAARVEFLPCYVQYINKMDAEYSQLNYAGVAQLGELGINYELLEAVLLNGIYVPSNMSVDDFLATISVTRDGGAMLVSNVMNNITYEYYIDERTGLLIKSVGTYRNGANVSCVYGDFQPLGERMFPASVELSLGGADKQLKLRLSLSKIRENGEFKATTPSASYKKVTPASLLKLFGEK